VLVPTVLRGNAVLAAPRPLRTGRRGASKTAFPRGAWERGQAASPAGDRRSTASARWADFGEGYGTAKPVRRAGTEGDPRGRRVGDRVRSPWVNSWHNVLGRMEYGRVGFVFSRGPRPTEARDGATQRH
jgi:hypothetical protein